MFTPQRKASIFKSNCLLVWAFLFFFQAAGQSKIDFSIFDKPLIGQLIVPSVSPSFQLSPQSFPNYNLTNPGISNAISQDQRNNQLIAEADRMIRLQQQGLPPNIEADLMEIPSYRREIEERNKTKSYRQAFSEICRLNPDSFSLFKAVYIVENAFFDNHLQEQTFIGAIKEKTELVKKIIKNEGLNLKDNLVLNYGIQKLFSKKSNYSIEINKQQFNYKTFSYDLEDYFGEKDYTKMFASKALATGTGQCHSLPLVYLLIAEMLGAKAQLSFAPQHSFIQFKNKEGKYINFETTNGNLVSNSWLMQSGYITSVALQKKTYLSALSNKQLYAHIVGDLLLGYLSKFPYDDFAEQIRQKVLLVNPNSSTALLVDANIKTLLAKEKFAQAGKPIPRDLHNYPEAYKAYLTAQTAYEKVEAIGYQDMPEEAYQKWLQSVEREKKKQSNKVLQIQIQQEALLPNHIKKSN